MARIKISIDDIRAIPDGYDLLFLSPENFISWRKDNPEITISELSLDHDMGLDYMDGYDLVKYMVHEDSMNIGSIERIQFHTEDVWENFQPKECTSWSSDYYEYHDKEYDSDGILSISHDGKYLDFQLPANHLYNRMYKFNKVKMQSFIYDTERKLEEN